MQLRSLFACLMVLVATSTYAQTTGPIRLHTSGIKVSPIGGFIPAGEVMADTGLMPFEASWSVMFQCSGAPKTEGNPPVAVGGYGIYAYERYNAQAAVYDQIEIAHTAYSQGGNKTISPAPIVAPTAVVGNPVLIVHNAMNQGGNQSIPPLTLLAGEGLRIRTLAPLQGILSCAMFMYIF